jgi:hypothetical protein
MPGEVKRGKKTIFYFQQSELYRFGELRWLVTQAGDGTLMESNDE